MNFRILSTLALLLGLAAAPMALRAMPAPAPIDSDQVLAELTRSLASHYQMEGDLQLDWVRPWTAPDAAAAVWRVELTEFPDRPMPTMAIRFRLVGDGVTVDEFSLLVRASVWRDAWFPREPLSSGASLTPDMLDVRRVDMLQERDAVPVTLGIRSFVAAREIVADRVVTWHDITLRPLVRKGEMVDVVAEDGMLVVTLKALALQNGAQGDLVTARNVESSREITGRVVGEDCIAITF